MFVAAILLAFPCTAIACEAEVDKFDNRIEISRDGSFENANITDPKSITLTYSRRDRIHFIGGSTFDFAAANAIRDRGNGKVAQLIKFSNYGCNGEEALLFVDCVSANTMLIFGDYPPDPEGIFGGGGMPIWTFIVYIQPPYGPINVTAQSTVEGLAKAAKRHKIEYLIGAEKIFAQVRKRDRYNVFLGCKLYYPDSMGAQK